MKYESLMTDGQTKLLISKLNEQEKILLKMFVDNKQIVKIKDVAVKLNIDYKGANGIIGGITTKMTEIGLNLGVDGWYCFVEREDEESFWVIGYTDYKVLKRVFEK